MALTIDLQGKTVFVSGGISGIGRGVARTFAEAGAMVVTCAEYPEEHELVQQFLLDFASEGFSTAYFQADLTDPSAIADLSDWLVEHHPVLDVLISNAGANVFAGVADCDQKMWDFNQKLNLESHWQLAKGLKPLLDRAENALIVLMSSNHAFASMSGCFPYNVAKAGLLAMVRSMALEWGPQIRTVGLAPGFIDTPGNQKWFDSFPDPALAREKTTQLHPVKRLGTANEIGGWCVFLASAYAAFASGTTYLIDGGRSALMQDE